MTSARVAFPDGTDTSRSHGGARTQAARGADSAVRHMAQTGHKVRTSIDAIIQAPVTGMDHAHPAPRWKTSHGAAMCAAVEAKPESKKKILSPDRIRHIKNR